MSPRSTRSAQKCDDDREGAANLWNDEADARLAQIALASCFEREAMAVGFDQLHCL